MSPKRSQNQPPANKSNKKRRSLTEPHRSLTGPPVETFAKVGENPRHREDFNSLLHAATRKREQAD